MSMLQQLFAKKSMRAINQIPIPRYPILNKPIWLSENFGVLLTNVAWEIGRVVQAAGLQHIYYISISNNFTKRKIKKEK